MIIRYEEFKNGVGGNLTTLCNECKWFSGGSCYFGRLEKYRELGLAYVNEADKNIVTTFCNYGRDNDDSPEKVVIDNKIRYDYIMRVDSVDNLSFDFEWMPRQIIVSYSGIPADKVLAAKLKAPSNTLFIEIFNLDNRDEIELGYCKSQFVAYYDQAKVSEAITKLDRIINQDLKKTVLYYGDSGFIFMRYFANWLMSQNISPCLENYIIATEDTETYIKED